jgi:hypothetical protein
MKTAKYTDYSQSLIDIKRLTVLVEQLYNKKDYDAALEAATELSIEARHMKTCLHHVAEGKK